MKTSSRLPVYLFVVAGLLAGIVRADMPPQASVVYDLSPLQDAARVLVNPHKGWYHHYPDNHPGKYLVAQDADLLEFAGMDHVYIRLAWSYLEPREGEFDWAVIDRIIDKWTAHGLGIAFRISCKETNIDRVEQQFATPRWVMEAGAKGGYFRRGEVVGVDGPWEPVWDDPIFLARLDKFLAAFAARYDGKPWLRYMDIGSIGDWGEGHTWAGSQKPCTFATRRTHVDLHLKHFKHAQLVISDDFVYALKNLEERQALHQHILAHGISYRDDSIMVDGYFDGSIDERFPSTSDSFTVRSPEFFADAYLRFPTVFELEHYGKVKKLGNWEGLPGSKVEKFGKGKKGPDFFRGALEFLHASYIGYHGDAREWLTDNPELTKELLNRCGYWLFPKSIELPRTIVAGETASITLVLENRGVAPPYAPYAVRLKFSGGGETRIGVVGQADRSWLPGAPITVHGQMALPSDMKAGRCLVSVGLFDSSSGKQRPVELAVRADCRDSEGFYRVAEVEVVSDAKRQR